MLFDKSTTQTLPLSYLFTLKDSLPTGGRLSEKAAGLASYARKKNIADNIFSYFFI
jgi:hypothetical protein